jgi:hypothetical protein
MSRIRRQPPSERSEHGKIAANIRWAKESDRTAATRKAREAAFQRFLDEADPDGVLLERERVKRAKNLQSAHLARVRRASLKSRRLARESRQHEGRSEDRPSPDVGSPAPTSRYGVDDTAGEGA